MPSFLRTRAGLETHRSISVTFSERVRGGFVLYDEKLSMESLHEGSFFTEKLRKLLHLLRIKMANQGSSSKTGEVT